MYHQNESIRKRYDHPLIPYEVEYGVENNPAMPDDAADILDEIYSDVVAGERRLINPLKQWIKEYPQIAIFKNHLFVVYMMNGKKRRAYKLLARIRKEHPDYLHGLTNQALKYLQEHEDTKKARELLGESLLIQDRFPKRSYFNVSQVMNYYQAVIGLLLMEKKIEEAKKYNDILLTIDKDHPIAQNQTREIATSALLSFREKLQQEQEKEIRVDSFPTVKYTQHDKAPSFNHSEIEAFYKYDVESLPIETQEALMALPRTTLAEDLKKVLEDAICRYEYFVDKVDNEWEEWRADRLNFPVHAFICLGALGYEELLPTVLDFLRQGEEFLDFWLGFELESITRAYFMKVAGNNLPTLQQFMLERNVFGYSKLTVKLAVAQVAWHEPERLPEIEEWFANVFDYFLKHEDDKGLIDTLVLGWSAIDAGNLGLTRLFPKVEQLYKKGFIPETYGGDLEELKGIFDQAREAREEHHKYPMPKNIKEAYDGSYMNRRAPVPPPTDDMLKLREQIEAANPYAETLLEMLSGAPPLEEEEEYEDDFFEPVETVQTVVRDKKIGRNEPCPCGSGKKYKRCCGKK